MVLRLTQAEYDRLMRGRSGKARKKRKVRAALPVQIGGRQVEPGVFLLTLPLPPSKNREPSNLWARVKLKKQFLEHAWSAWAVAGCPRFECARIKPRFFVHSPRDPDNSNGCAFKGVLDGLKGHLMPDDDPEHLVLEEPEYVVDRTAMRLELEIRQAKTARI